MNLTLKKSLLVATLTLVIPSVASAATLSVSPSSQSVKRGDTFKVSIRLDTQGKSIDGVDIRYLNFNPGLLQVVDENASQSGVQITAESLMPISILNSVDNSLGRIAFSQLAAGGTKYKGSGILATVTFKALSSGSAAISFNHTPNSTTDSNVAVAGKDALVSVVNGTFNITATGSNNTPGIPSQTTPGQSGTTQSGTTQSGTNSTGTNPDGSVTPGQTGEQTTGEEPQFSEKKSFWQIIWEMIKNFFSSFGTRVRGN